MDNVTYLADEYTRLAGEWIISLPLQLIGGLSAKRDILVTHDAHFRHRVEAEYNYVTKELYKRMEIAEMVFTQSDVELQSLRATAELDFWRTREGIARPNFDLWDTWDVPAVEHWQGLLTAVIAEPGLLPYVNAGFTDVDMMRRFLSDGIDATMAAEVSR